MEIKDLNWSYCSQPGCVKPASKEFVFTEKFSNRKLCLEHYIEHKQAFDSLPKEPVAVAQKETNE